MVDEHHSAGRLAGPVAEDIVGSQVPGTSTAKAIIVPVFQRIVRWWYRGFFLNEDGNAAVARYHVESKNLLTYQRGNVTLPVPQVVVLDNTDGHLSLSQLRFRVDENAFDIDADLKARSENVFKKFQWYVRTCGQKYFNGQLLRLAGLDLLDGKATVAIVQPVMYEAVCRTHLCLDAKEPFDAQSIRETVHPNGRLEPLECSRFANALGVNWLLFTVDGRVILPMRTNKVIVRPSQLSPSASGDFDIFDAHSDTTLESMPKLREAFEELNVVEGGHLEKGSARFLALTRELVRGGKPEMFFVCKSKLSQSEVQKLHAQARDSFEYSRRYSKWVFWDFGTDAATEEPDESARFRLRHRFEELLDSHGSTISVPLLTNIVLWLKSKNVFPS